MRTVTVIIPSNRLNHWMDEAVASVLGSTGVDVDLVVVLDGITADALPQWASDPRVTIVRHSTSRGPAAGMLSGLVAARSDLVARLDSDDLCEPQRLAVQSGYLDEHPETVAVSSRTMRIDEQGVPTGLVRLPAGEDIRPELLLSNVVPHSALMFRRAAGEEVGSYDPALRQMEDYDFILRLAGRGPLAQLEEPLVKYRVHASQTSRGAKPFGRHIRRVLKERRALSRVLKRSALTGFLKNAAWVGVQYLRYYGVIRPGHER